MFTTSIVGTCWKCTEKQTGARNANHICKRHFKLVRAYHTFFNDTRKEYRDAWECAECGELVPVETFEHYQMTGDIVVRAPHK